MNNTKPAKCGVGLGPVGEFRKGMKNSQGPTYYILIRDCEIIRQSKDLDYLIDQKIKNNHNWSIILKCNEVLLDEL